jgi:hypothetical protein
MALTENGEWIKEHKEDFIQIGDYSHRYMYQNGIFQLGKKLGSALNTA